MAKKTDEITELSEILTTALASRPDLGERLSTLLGRRVDDPAGLMQPRLTKKQRKEKARNLFEKKFLRDELKKVAVCVVAIIIFSSCAPAYNMQMPVKVIGWTYERGNRVLTVVNDCNDTIPYTEYRSTVRIRKDQWYSLLCDTSKTVTINRKSFYRCTLRK